MWSEESDMENKIRKAAETETGSHRFELKDWQKMEAMLDEYLPQEKKRRRFIFILLFSGLIVATGIFLIQKSSTKNISIADQTQKTEQVNIKIISPDKTAQQNNTIVPVENKNINIETVDKKNYTDNLTEKENNTLPAKTISGLEKKVDKVIAGKNAITANNEIVSVSKPTVTKKENQQIKSNDPVNKNDDQATDNPVKPTQSESNTDITTTPITGSPEKNETGITNIEKKEDKVDSTEASEETKTDEKQSVTKKKNNKFSINLSAGTDISSVGTKPGNAEIAYGIGIGYSLSDRWTIRTGFFAGRKKYDAKAEDYHPADPNFWYYYPNMQNIDANCYVYEIPVNIVYNFSKKRDHNWFISGGISSYFMKEEKYDYTYKNWAGQLRNVTRTYKNVNSHLFSVIDISGGYQYHFSKRFSLLAEPYLKMPVSGIGFGKVNLNSAGIMFTGSFKPFGKN